MDEVKRYELIASMRRFTIMFVICVLVSLAINQFFVWASSGGVSKQNTTRRAY